MSDIDLPGLNDLIREFGKRPHIPMRWVRWLQAQHPVTAIVAWEVLSGRLDARTIALAEHSPDYPDMVFLQAVAHGNASLAEAVGEVAYDLLMEEIEPEGEYRTLH
jgi:hypothetical protein